VSTTIENHPVVESLAAFASLPDWLAAGMDPGRVGASLTRNVPDLASGRMQLVSCTPERLRAKGKEWLARYTVDVADRGAEPRRIVLVGNLYGPSQRPPDVDTVAAHVPLTDPRWRGVLPDLGLVLRSEERDEALPALRTLVDPAATAGLLAPILHDAGYRNATITSCEPVVVRYKPGSRCTVVVHLGYGEDRDGTTAPSPVVLKTHQGDKGEAAWAAMTALWQRPQHWRGAVTLAEPLAYLPEQRILVQGPVPEERTLKQLAREALASGDPTMLGGLKQQLSTTAAALAALHGSGVSYGPTATLEEEIGEVEEVVDRLALSVPELAAAARPLLRELTARSGAEPPDPVVPAHHTFRPAQVLLADEGVGFIDFDSACMAEPAVDLGRFRASLRDIGISTPDLVDSSPSAAQLERRLGLLDELCEHVLVAYQQHAVVSRERVLLWESCELMTTLLHAWTKVRLSRVLPRLALLTHQLRSSGALDGPTRGVSSRVPSATEATTP
jgi:hypothetical protein